MPNPTVIPYHYLQASPSYTWVDGDVYSIPQTDQQEGWGTGASFSGIGVDNEPHQALLNKLNYLKRLFDGLSVNTTRTIVKPADQPYVVPANDVDFTFAIAANEIWRIDFRLHFLWTAGTGGSVQFNLQVPGGAHYALYNDYCGWAYDGNLQLFSGTSDLATHGFISYPVSAVVKNAGTAGSVTLRYMSMMISSGVKALSTMDYIKLS